MYVLAPELYKVPPSWLGNGNSLNWWGKPTASEASSLGLQHLSIALYSAVSKNFILLRNNLISKLIYASRRAKRVRNALRLFHLKLHPCAVRQTGHTLTGHPCQEGEREKSRLVQQTQAAPTHPHNPTAWIGVTPGTWGHPSSPPLDVSTRTAMVSFKAWFHLWSCTI